MTPAPRPDRGVASVDGVAGVAAVIGSPVGHSLSPAIQNCAFDQLGIDWRFVAFEVGAGQSAAAVAAMQTLGIRGFAVTTPLKEEIAGVVDEVDVAARNLGSVNTVVLRSDGSTFGASTDGAGFVASLERCDVELAGARVVVLGAGAAGRSIIDALGRSGVGDIAVINRTPAAATRAVALAAQARIGSPADIASASILINTTSVGMGDPDASPVDDQSLLRADLVVADIVYHPLDTRLLRDAAAAGAVTVDGLAMLVCQAQLQQRLWLGKSGDFDAMRSAAQAQLSGR